MIQLSEEEWRKIYYEIVCFHIVDKRGQLWENFISDLKQKGYIKQSALEVAKDYVKTAESFESDHNYCQAYHSMKSAIVAYEKAYEEKPCQKCIDMQTAMKKP